MQNLTLDLTQTFSEKEQTIYGLLCQNLNNAEISEIAQISIPGVKYHLIHIYKKLGVESDCKSDLTNARARAISYSGTKIEQIYQSKMSGFSEHEIRKAAMQLTWYPNIREVMSDLFLALDGKLSKP